MACDTRGAIMIVGLVMGTLLVGALWNIVSIGDAVVWREHLQDAADAAAFESAVWNARGMNVIVFLNIVLSGIMSVVVALRGAVIFFSALAAALNAAALGCLFPVTPITAMLCALATYAPTANTLWRNSEQLEQRLVPRLMRVMRGVQTAQMVTATVVPVIGLRESGIRTSLAYDMPAIGVSPSLLPAFGGAVGSTPRLGRGVSLPVSEGDSGKLCEKAGEFIPNEVIALLRELNLPDDILEAGGGFFRTLAREIAGNLSTVFCGSQSPRDIAQLTEQFRQLAREKCDSVRQSGRVSDASEHTPEQRMTLEDYQQYWEPGFVTGSDGSTERGHVFNGAKCEQDEINRVSLNYQPPETITPAKVWDLSQNGEFFMQAWGFAYREPSTLSRNDRAIGFPAPGRAASVAADAYELGTAQAEMYWDTDQATGSGCDGSWGACEGDSMWLMRWRARLRRLHDPREMALRTASRVAVDQITGAIEDAIGRLAGLGEGAFANWARGRRWELLSHVIRGQTWGAAYSFYSDVVGGPTISDGVEQTVGDRLRADPPAPSELIIH